MKKILLCLSLLLMLSGCVVHGSSLRPLDALKKQSQKAFDAVVYQQASAAMENTQNSSYSIKVEQTSGPLMTLLVDENQQVNQMIVHGQGYTQWIQIFDDRILCLTGDDGHVQAQLLENLNGYGDMETIVQCALNPVSLVQGRHLQRTSGAEVGSSQIATDNIDFWMKVSNENTLSQVKLYFSNLPMMTLYYSLELPLFPIISKKDYPLYRDIIKIDESILVEHGFELIEGQYVRQKDKKTETLMFDADRLDYIISDKKHSIHLVYDELIVKGMHTALDEPAYCEVNFTSGAIEDSELSCSEEVMNEMMDSFEQLKNEFKNDLE